MDVQQQIRLSTEFIMWASDLVDKISGHTGTFQRLYQGKWMTEKQSLMHEVRDDAISKRSNPATAVIEALGTHLRLTEHVEGLAKSAVYQSDDASKALMSDGYSLKEHSDLVEQLGRQRDKLKHFVDHFRQHAEPPPNSSPLRANFGGPDYQPESPKQYPDDDYEVEEKQGSVKGNPVPSLAHQWRMGHNMGAPKPIQKAPVHAAIEEAKTTLDVLLGKVQSRKIYEAAKRKAKKECTEDSSADEFDQIMIGVYLDRCKANKSIKGMDEVIAMLEKAKT
jgi:hypothetical protein